MAGSPWRKVSQGWGLEGPEEWSLRTLTAGRDLLSKTKGRLQRAAVNGTPRETRAKRPGDGPGQERTGHRRTDRRTGLRERRKVGGQAVPRGRSHGPASPTSASQAPLAGSQVPRPQDPRGGRTSGLQGGGDACPGCGQRVGPVEPESLPTPHRPFPSPASRVSPPHTPVPRLCPEPEETMTSVPVPFAKGTEWRDTPLPRPQAEGGLRGVRSFPSSSKRVVGPGEVAGLVGRLRVCLGQGGEAPWSGGCWTPRAQEGRPGAGRTCAEGADEPPLPAQAHPWGTVGSRLPSRAPFPAPGRQEAQASRRPEPGSAICFPVFTQPQR